MVMARIIEMKRSVSKATRVALGLGMLATLVAAAPAEDEWEKQVRALLERAANATSSNGFVETHDSRLSSLKDDESETWTIKLNAGTEYRIIGVCDNDCSDLDLKLFNAAGTNVSEDVETDDVPVLLITPPATREYTVRAIMVDCDASPCRYGVGVYGR